MRDSEISVLTVMARAGKPMKAREVAKEAGLSICTVWGCWSRLGKLGYVQNIGSPGIGSAIVATKAAVDLLQTIVDARQDDGGSISVKRLWDPAYDGDLPPLGGGNTAERLSKFGYTPTDVWGHLRPVRAPSKHVGWGWGGKDASRG